MELDQGSMAPYNTGMKRAVCLLLLAACDDPLPPPAPPAARVDPRAPDVFRARVLTTKGVFTIECRREWSPRGADRFHALVKSGYYADIALFRVMPSWVVQFGLHGDPKVNEEWFDRRFPDDPRVLKNERGTVTFATSGANTRNTQLFVNMADNARLDNEGFTPIGRVVDGMGVLNLLYGGYGEGPRQERIIKEGNAFLRADYPNLDYVQSITLEE